jgi:competence protein ComEC
VLSFLTEWSVRSVQLFDAAPLSAVRVPVVSAWWALAATMLAIYWIRAGHRRDWRAWTGSAAVGAWAAWLCVLGPRLPSDVALRIDTLSVGNGSCHLIRSGEEAMLWDCGSMKSGGVQPAIVQSVRALGAWRTPVVVITHPDMDHFSGLPQVLEPLGVHDVYLCERFVSQAREQPRGSAAAFVTELERRGVAIHVAASGDVLGLGEAKLTLLNPPPGAAWKLDNDHSLVARVDVAHEPDGRPCLLMTGDIQEDASVVAAITPCLGFRPIDLYLRKGNGALWILFQREITICH